MALVSSFFDPGGVMLLIYPGARSMGMGGAYGAAYRDPLAMYYNIGSLAFAPEAAMSFSIYRWLPALKDDMLYEHGALWVPTRYGNFGFHQTWLYGGEFDVYDEYGNYRGKYSPYDLELTLGYGKRITPYIGAGLGLKYFHSYFAPDWVMREILGEPGGGTARVFTGDLGLLAAYPDWGLSAGFSFNNLLGRVDYTPSTPSTWDPMPKYYRFAAAWKVIEFPVLSCLFAYQMDRDMVSGPTETWHAYGTEFSFLRFLYLRWGHFRDDEGQRVGNTFGTGVEIGPFAFDVSQSPIYAFGESDTRFTLTLRNTMEIPFMRPDFFRKGRKRILFFSFQQEAAPG